jgi:ubiquinone biosynthesis protein Coq4
MNPIRNTLLAARVLWSFADLVRHPEHLDRVFEISGSLASRRQDVIQRMRDHFALNPGGAAALRERPRLQVRLAELSAMPAGTLGRVFADHMRANGLDPAAIPTLPARNELEYVQAHLYETHDVWHAVTGFNTDVAGELGLQAFYAAQAPGGLPLMLLAVGFLNTALFAIDERERRLEAIVRGWEMGRRAAPLFGVRWGELWGRPLDEVRVGLRVDCVAPTPAAAA